ncbi:MAG: hypothetical protein JOY56_01470 [Solirubrobacterales bacterium]|nr:hypothetical protein [Solirubrobacterales bacterium]
MVALASIPLLLAGLVRRRRRLRRLRAELAELNERQARLEAAVEAGREAWSASTVAAAIPPLQGSPHPDLVEVG